MSLAFLQPVTPATTSLTSAVGVKVVWVATLLLACCKRCFSPQDSGQLGLHIAPASWDKMKQQKGQNVQVRPGFMSCRCKEPHSLQNCGVNSFEAKAPLMRFLQQVGHRTFRLEQIMELGPTKSRFRWSTQELNVIADSYMATRINYPDGRIFQWHFGKVWGKTYAQTCWKITQNCHDLWLLCRPPVQKIHTGDASGTLPRWLEVAWRIRKSKRWQMLDHPERWTCVDIGTFWWLNLCSICHLARIQPPAGLMERAMARERFVICKLLLYIYYILYLHLPGLTSLLHDGKAGCLSNPFIFTTSFCFHTHTGPMSTC